MPVFEIRGKDGNVYEIDAPDEGAAVSAFAKSIGGTQVAPKPNKDWRLDPPPEGMVSDPKTGAMIDTKAIAERQSGGLGGMLGDIGATAVSGFPFVGQWFDEAAGAGDPVRQQVARERMKGFEAANPKTAAGLRIAGGLSTLPLLRGASGMLPATLPAQVGLGLVGGGVGGAAEGAISGYGRGETPETRADYAQKDALIGGGLGAAFGAAAPLVARGASWATQNIADALTTNRQARSAGMDPRVAKALARGMQADDALTGAGANRIAAAGPDAMLADAGPTARSMLDTAIQRAGPAARLATEAVDGRAVAARQNLETALDATLGNPNGIRAAAKDIADSSSAARSAAYEAAYAQPIDYASQAGQAVEDVFNRTPPTLLRSAITRANDEMLVAGKRNMQILADIAPDGTVSFREMPNAIQVDMLKRKLGDMAAEAVDQFGRPTSEGRMIGQLAKELRDAGVKAIPGYDKALKLGGDKIAEDTALDLGTKLFSPATTREMVAERTAGMMPAERARLAQGLRSKIDEALANVQRTVMDGNTDAREAVKIIKDFSSRANREKLAAAIGGPEAEALLQEVDRAAMALDLRAGVAANSRTYARQVMDDTIAPSGGAVEALMRGEPVNAGKRAIQAMTGFTDDAMRARKDKIAADIAMALTGPRGQNAVRALNALNAVGSTGARNAIASQLLGRSIASGLALPAFLEGKRAARSK